MGETSETADVEAVRLVGMGPLPPDFAAALAARLSQSVTAACRLEGYEHEGPLPRIDGRDQIDADRLLKCLLDLPPRPATLVVGVTPLDIAIPIFTFVFGRARCPGPAAVVSTARLDPTFYGLPADLERTLHRAVDEIRHELGHAAGLAHCDEAACLMRFAGYVEQVDVRGSAFCPGCAARLPRGLRPAPSAVHLAPE